jgi:hypothetical protein
LFGSLCSMSLWFPWERWKQAAAKVRASVLFVGGFTCARQVSKLNILRVFNCLSLCSWTKWIQYLNLVIYDKYLDEPTSLSNNGAWESIEPSGLVEHGIQQTRRLIFSCSVIQEPSSELNRVNPWMWLNPECGPGVLILLVYVILPCFSEDVGMTALMGVSWQDKDADHRTCPRNMLPARYIMFMVLCFYCDSLTEEVHQKLKAFNTPVHVSKVAARWKLRKGMYVWTAIRSASKVTQRKETKDFSTSVHKVDLMLAHLQSACIVTLQ